VRLTIPALALAAAVAAAACSRHDATRETREEHGEVADTMPLDTLDMLAAGDSGTASVPGMARDTLVALGGPGARATADSAAGPAGEVAPSAAELTLLQSELAMPVAGVERSALIDSFDEGRGGGSRRHEALDIPAPRRTPVLSATPGRVLKLFSSKDGGLMVYAADSSERFVLMYAHLDGYAPGLAEGAPLRRGETIGFVGTTGNAPPDLPHLHFAIARTADVSKWWTGTPVNPYPLLREGL
jgi:murein DD-endopeptidase MepM/ murein hydrolase activator NlpD